MINEGNGNGHRLRTVTKKTGLIYEPRFRDAAVQSVSQAVMRDRDGHLAITRIFLQESAIFV